MSASRVQAALLRCQGFESPLLLGFLFSMVARGMEKRFLAEAWKGIQEKTEASNESGGAMKKCKNPRGVYERAPGSNVWWIRYHDSEGRKHCERIGTRSQAINMYRKRKTEAWE